MYHLPYHNLLWVLSSASKLKKQPKICRTFLIDFQFFSDMDRLQNCIVHSLEKCDESTPANLVESMFKFVRNETPCINMTVSF